jgi:hypothetical protein
MRFLAIPAFVILAACSHVDTGEIDYRRAEPAQDLAKNIANYHSICGYQSYDALTAPGVKMSRREQACLPLLAGKLFRKNIGVPETQIGTNDIYSIRLEHGLISFMTEPDFTPERIFYGKRVRVQVGEIVVLANVFEFGEDGKDQRFNDLTDLNQVKVIYYSPDVEARQDLNFSNIPLKAPAAYNGNPIGIQIIVMELDRMSTQMQSLLKTLAGLGQQSNLAPAGPAGSVLLDLGTSMLTQNNDDTIFEYRFVLDPSDGKLSAQSAPFEAGRYVIKRTNDRRDDQIWRNLVVDHNTGRLMRLAYRNVPGPNDKTPPETLMVPPVPYTEDTYFTINVIKHPEGTSAGGYGFKSLEELGKEIETAASKRDEPFAQLDTALQGKLADLRRSSRAEELVKGWNSASKKYRAYAQSIDPGTADKQCNKVSDYDQRLSQAKYEAVSAAVDFHRMYREAITETDAKGSPIFSAEHKVRVLSMMAAYFQPQKEGSVQITELVDPTAFDNTYAQESYEPLVKAMDVMATLQWQAKGCDDLIAAGLAHTD